MNSEYKRLSIFGAPTNKNAGFTIVELLIVVVVIAILAAITIVSYNGITNRANESSAKSATNQVAKRIMTHSIQNGAGYPDSLSEIGVTNASGTSYQYTVDNESSTRFFCLTATVKNYSFYTSSSDTSVKAGGCVDHAANGNAYVWPISDAFEANETPPAQLDTGQNWRVESGTWTQSGGVLSAAADSAIIVAPIGSTTQTVEYTIAGTMIASSVPTVVLRYDNANDYHYRFEKVNTSELRVTRRDPSATILLQTNPGVVSGGDRVRIAVTGAAGAATFRIWVNGQEITTLATGSFTDTDTSPPLGTEAGFRWAFSGSGNGYRYDDFSAAGFLVVP